MGEGASYFVESAGDVWGRVVPTDFEAPEGSAVLVLGSVDAGRIIRLDPTGNLALISQTSIPVPAGTNFVSLKGKIRGPERMPILSDVENFALADGDTLVLKVDGGPNQTVTFDTADFAAIATARAVEVGGVLNRDIAGAKARLTGDGALTLLSNTKGRRSNVEIVGGTAAAALGFAAYTWRAYILHDSNEVIASIEIRVGETRDLSDLGGSIATFADPLSSIDFALRVEPKL